jgi:hypothetical protein
MNATNCCIRVNHGVYPRFALLARRSNDFRSPKLELARLCTLVRDGRSSLELVKVLLRFFYVDKNGVVGRQDDFGGRSEQGGAR